MPDVKAVLATAVERLYDTDQPDGAIMTHHGPGGTSLGDRSYSVTPTGALNLPVIVVSVADWHLGQGRWHGFEGDYDSDRYSGWREPDQNEPCAEILGVASMLAEMGAEVRETWNGAAHSTSGSIGLAAPARPSLLAAVARYCAHCPAHNSVFCGRAEACTWLADGWRLVVPPAWPVTEEAPHG